MFHDKYTICLIKMEGAAFISAGQMCKNFNIQCTLRFFVNKVSRSQNNFSVSKFKFQKFFKRQSTKM